MTAIDECNPIYYIDYSIVYVGAFARAYILTDHIFRINSNANGPPPQPAVAAKRTICERAICSGVSLSDLLGASWCLMVLCGGAWHWMDMFAQCDAVPIASRF